jgi:DNA-binding transcriptional ArsR family regulator
MPAARKSKDGDIFVAMAHPLRRRILRHMVAIGAETSPRDLADDLEQTLNKVSYHVMILARCGAVELAGTKQVRGSTQHFYRPTVEDRWAMLALKASADGPGEGRR